MTTTNCQTDRKYCKIEAKFSVIFVFQGVTLSSQKLADVELNDNNISEIMRIFIKSRNGREDEVRESKFTNI